MKVTYTKLGREKRKKAIILILQWQVDKRAEAKVGFTTFWVCSYESPTPELQVFEIMCTNSWNSYIS